MRIVVEVLREKFLITNYFLFFKLFEIETTSIDQKISFYDVKSKDNPLPADTDSERLVTKGITPR